MSLRLTAWLAITCQVLMILMVGLGRVGRVPDYALVDLMMGGLVCTILTVAIGLMSARRGAQRR